LVEHPDFMSQVIQCLDAKTVLMLSVASPSLWRLIRGAGGLAEEYVREKKCILLTTAQETQIDDGGLWAMTCLAHHVETVTKYERMLETVPTDQRYTLERWASRLLLTDQRHCWTLFPDWVRLPQDSGKVWHSDMVTIASMLSSVAGFCQRDRGEECADCDFDEQYMFFDNNNNTDDDSDEIDYPDEDDFDSSTDGMIDAPPSPTSTTSFVHEMLSSPGSFEATGEATFNGTHEVSSEASMKETGAVRIFTFVMDVPDGRLFTASAIEKTRGGTLAFDQVKVHHPEIWENMTRGVDPAVFAATMLLGTLQGPNFTHAHDLLMHMHGLTVVVSV
jgi:hypothetical protein